MGFALKKPENEPGAAWPAIVIGLFVAFGGVLFGYDTGLISGILAMPSFIHEFKTGSNEDITGSEESLIVSILSAGTFFGALFAAPLVDWLGRKYGLMLSAGVVFNFGVILQTAAASQPVMIAGRFFAGFGVGLISMMIPLYQSETAPKWIRGAVVGAYQFAITIGLFLAACVNHGTKSLSNSAAYRIPIGIQFAWSIILVVGLLFLPETPRFLIRQDKHEKAAASLSKLRRLPVDHPSMVEELGEITANHQYEMSITKATYLDCFKGSIGRRLLTGCMLQGLQQLAGINFIMYYGTSYFERAGFAQGGFTIQIILNVVNVVSTLPGLYLTDKMGRRNLLLMGSIGMTVSQFLVAIIGTTSGGDDLPADAPDSEKNLPAQRAAIAFCCFFIYFFASTWGPVAWVVTGEMFPLQVRAKCLSMTTASNWLLNWAIAYSTPYLVDEGEANMKSKVFFVWASCCALSIFFVYFMIYETKGLTLEQVDELFTICPKAWESNKFRAQLSDAAALKEGEKSLSLKERKTSADHVEEEAKSEF